jgi:hypothetical protein
MEHSIHPSYSHHKPHPALFWLLIALITFFIIGIIIFGHGQTPTHEPEMEQQPHLPPTFSALTAKPQERRRAASRYLTNFPMSNAADRTSAKARMPPQIPRYHWERKGGKPFKSSNAGMEPRGNVEGEYGSFKPSKRTEEDEEGI